MEKRFFKITLPIIILLIAIIIVVLLILTKSPPKVRGVPEKVFQVSAVKVTPKAYSPMVILFGRVESPRQANLRAAVEADVISTPVLEGNMVEVGELVIKLDPSDAKLLLQQRTGEVKALEAQIASEKLRYESDIESLKNEQQLVKSAERQVKRLEELVRKKVGSEAELDDAKEDLFRQSLTLRKRELNVKNHKHRLENLNAQRQRAAALQSRARLDLQRTFIRSPFNGRVSKLYVAVGNRVRPGDRLINVFDIDALEVRAEIPDRYFTKISDALNTGEKISADAKVNGHTIKLVYNRVAAEVARGRTGADVLFKITSGGEYLPLGKTIEIVVKFLPEKGLVALPSSALYGLDRIYKVVDGRLEAVDVERSGSIIYPDGERRILVKSAKLQAGDEVVSTQLPNAISGLKVQVVRE